MLGCPRFTKILLGHMSDINLLSRARCKMWDCEYCAEINKRIWQAKILKHLHSEETPNDWSFITITSSSKRRTPLATLTNLRGSWPRIIQRLRRKFTDPQYIRILEQHKDGAIHLHALISVVFDDVKQAKTPQGKQYSYSPQFRRICRECGAGWAGSVEHLNRGFIQASGYVTKYMTKDIANIAKIAPKIRAIQASQDFAKTKLDKKGSWSVIEGLTYHEFNLILKSGNPIFDVQTQKFVTSDDYIESDIYPLPETVSRPDNLD